MREFTTPMMKQYAAIKKQYLDCLLFFRLGDFYELFLEDATIGSEVLDITLTSRPKGRDGRIPMAGVPYHAVDSYLAKLVKAGYKVAICEQVSEPDKKGIVEREVVRVVTPGTVLDEKFLEKKENNYLVSLLIDGDSISISAADISTGLVKTQEMQTPSPLATLSDELTRLNPSECILPPHLYNDPEILKFLKKQKGLNIYVFQDWDTITSDAKRYLKNHFGLKSLESFAIEDKPLAIKTCAALLAYLKETQKDHISHIKKIGLVDSSDFVSLDRSTMINLELFSTIREHDTRGTLLSVIDQTATAMGGRMLKSWIMHPLHEKSLITKRHDSVEEFLKNAGLRSSIKKILVDINDVERILSRLSVGIGNPRDMISLKESLIKILSIKHKLINCDALLNQKIQSSISTSLQKAIQLIESAILDEPVISIKDGGIIKNGIDKKLDKLRQIIGNGKQYILDLESRERKRSGINTLKVRFNQVFGFYIEVSRANSHLVPKDFMRKQTLVNAERFITPELKRHEELILNAEEKQKLLEYKIYQETLQNILTLTAQIQKACTAIAMLDCIINFSEIANKNHYTRPVLLYSGEIRIKKGRHPVVEKLLDDKQFVPNDVTLDNIKQQLLIITGPNMAGKSVYIRQVAVIVLLAQIGSFVPAQSANISIADKIFVRSGASDVITSGLSTFMVEMVETAYILNHATKNSLIVMDEIGRGTSTYDGISIAWAVAEYLVNFKTPPKTLFATHYHELQELENKYPKKIKNYHMSVSEENGEPVFLHTIMKGGASHSFGVAVARLAGIPDSVIENAYQILHQLEKRKANKVSKKTTHTKHNSKIESEIQKINIDKITPLEALNTLAKLQKIHE